MNLNAHNIDLNILNGNTIDTEVLYVTNIIFNLLLSLEDTYPGSVALYKIYNGKRTSLTPEQRKTYIFEHKLNINLGFI